MEPLEVEFTLECSSEHAFNVWATKTSLWWPSDHSVSAAKGLTVTFEPRRGGRIYERTPEVEHDWGEVLAWEPPSRLSYLWHIGADRSHATEVEITFTGSGGMTTVTIVHGGWERLGAEGPGRRERNRQGWNGLIPHFRQACINLRRG